MQNIKTAPTFFIIKNVVEIKNVKKRDINKNVKNVFYIYGLKHSANESPATEYCGVAKTVAV